MHIRSSKLTLLAAFSAVTKLGRPPPAPSSRTLRPLYRSSCVSRYVAKARAAFHLMFEQLRSARLDYRARISQVMTPKRVIAHKTDVDFAPATGICVDPKGVTLVCCYCSWGRFRSWRLLFFIIQSLKAELEEGTAYWEHSVQVQSPLCVVVV